MHASSDWYQLFNKFKLVHTECTCKICFDEGRVKVGLKGSQQKGRIEFKKPLLL